MRLRRPRNDVPEHVLRQLKRRRRTRRGIFVALVLVAVSVFLDRAGVFRYRGDDWAAYDKQTVTVTRVVDGDTVRVRKSPASEEETVRLLGIDAPETADPPAHWGAEATAHLQTLVESKPVTLRLDATQTRDKYRRLLAYVHVSDAENVNLALVRDGHAYAHRMFTHSLRRQFEQAEDDARGKGRGLWADLDEAQMPAWRQSWLANRRGSRE
jgi:micrococcal nuclease